MDWKTEFDARARRLLGVTRPEVKVTVSLSCESRGCDTCGAGEYHLVEVTVYNPDEPLVMRRQFEEYRTGPKTASRPFDDMGEFLRAMEAVDL